MKRNHFIVLLLLIWLPVSSLSAQVAGENWGKKLLAQFPFLSEPDTVSVVVIGDVMMHSRQLEADFGPFLSHLSSRLKAADVAIANMEFTLAGPPYSGYPAFSAPDSYAAYVQEQGVNLFLTANNHILDKGRGGLERTCATYRKMEAGGGLRVTGTAENPGRDTTTYPLIVPVKGIRLAFLNFTYGTNAGCPQGWPKVNYMKKEDILPAIERARRRKADFIIALPHWGDEYRLEHSDRQEEMAHWLAGNGVDAIVGAHPHVIQDYEEIRVCGQDGQTKTVPVYYSIGNAVSNMSAENTRLELMVRLTFTRNARDEMEFLPTEAEYLWCTLPGRLTHSYATIPVRDFIGRKSEWKIPSDYDNMINTYHRIQKTSGITDQ